VACWRVESGELCRGEATDPGFVETFIVARGTGGHIKPAKFQNADFTSSGIGVERVPNEAGMFSE
jgi:hypothetical protein